MHSLSSPSKLRTGFAVTGFALGAAAWSGHPTLLPLLLLLPLAIRAALPSGSFWYFLVAYQAGATWTLVPGSRVFFGAGFHPLDALTLWAFSIAAIALPYAAIRLVPAKYLPLTLSFALIASALLPTGIEDPLTLAGILFPRLGWAGLILTIVLFAALAHRQARVCCASIAVLSIACNLANPGTPAVPASWAAVNTNFGGSGFTSPNPMRLYHDALYIQTTALESPARITVYPETVIEDWNEATDMMWEPVFGQLARQGRTVLIGAEQHGADPRQYSNVLIVRGATQRTFHQRVPIPVAMWNPLNGHGVRMDPYGPSTMMVGPSRIAPIICYEELLTFPVLASVYHKPDILVAVANDYWARGTPIPAIQAESIAAWSRLFWIPLVSAVNQ